MNATRNRVKSIFLDAVVNHPPERWDSFLDEACDGDEDLRRRVRVLLEAHQSADSFVDEPDPAATATSASPFAEPLGTTIGPYKLLEVIGEGGMGTVYMAEQAEPVRRRVALKVIKPGMDSKQVVARFEAERQALAMMDHPNIARVFDGGMTPSGRPYFVMELVRGLPITEHCDAEKLSIPERLELFVLVCRAVQHAHQKGVIHRDLKPSNILVTVIDGAAVPKVIDFGVAKATGQALTEKTLFTGFHQFVGTPLYVSPEQAELSGTDVDTRSDIYSLGVLLYELLTGTTPLDSETLKLAAFDEMRRIIREEEPQKPSTRLSSLGATLTTTSASRGADPRRLNRVVRGELDWIAMKALEKDRRRRYETANDFAADVMRYLTDRPVEACPPSATYRLVKYARRNRAAFSAAALVALSLILGTGVSLWQATVARVAQRRAESAERQAATEAAVARAVNEFLRVDLLGQVAGARAGQDAGGDPHLTVKEALDRASARIGDRFRDQPLVEAAIRTSIGTSYSSLANQRLAVPHLERATELRRVHLGSDHPDTLGNLTSLSQAYSWTGRHPDAIALARETLERWHAAVGPHHPATLGALVRLGEALQMAGQWHESTQVLEVLFDARRLALGPTHPDTLGTMHPLALNLGETGRLAESMALHENLLELLRARGGLPHKSPPWVLRTYAQVCQRAGDLDRADELLRECLEIEQGRDDSPGRRISIANTQGWQALNLVLRGRFAEAEPLAREAEATFEELRPHDPRRFYWMSVRGAALTGMERHPEAEPLLLRGYAGMKEREAVLQGFDWPRFAEAGERVVAFYKATRQPQKARAWLERLAVARRRE